MHYHNCKILISCVEAKPFKMNPELLYFFPVLRKIVNEKLASYPYKKIIILVEVNIECEMFKKVLRMARLVHRGKDTPKNLDKLDIHYDFHFFKTLQYLKCDLLIDIMTILPQFQDVTPTIPHAFIDHRVFF